MIMLSIKGSCRHNPAKTIMKSPVEYLSLSAASSLNLDHSSIRFNHSVITVDLKDSTQYPMRSLPLCALCVTKVRNYPANSKFPGLVLV